MPDLPPEQLARQQIDGQLVACGWLVQDFKAVDFSAGRGVALREVTLKSGPCDYLLLVDRIPVGVVEAKKTGATLSGVAEQSARYASSVPDFLAAGQTGPLPFLYESTGVETFFRDQRDPDARSRQVFSFHRPETLAAWAGVPLKTLLQRALFLAGRDEDTLTTLAARLARLDRELEPAQSQQIAAASGGNTPATLAGALLRASILTPSPSTPLAAPEPKRKRSRPRDSKPPARNSSQRPAPPSTSPRFERRWKP
jgi:type I site-specific restriction endonuclease